MYYLVLCTDPTTGALVHVDASRDLRFAARTVRDHEPDSPPYCGTCASSGAAPRSRR